MKLNRTYKKQGASAPNLLKGSVKMPEGIWPMIGLFILLWLIVGIVVVIAMIIIGYTL